MPNDFVVLPMFAMLLITAGVLAVLFRTRSQGVREGTVSAGYYKTYQGESESEAARKLTRHFTNLFETPVLFYAVCTAALATQHATLLFQILAWAYVATRLFHAIIHIGANRLMNRIRIYFLSWLLLLALWLVLVFRIITTV